MSYLLDALNKAEQAKRNQKLPTLDPVQRIPGTPGTRKWILLSVSVLVLINIGGLWYFYWPDKIEPVMVSETVLDIPESNQVVKASENVSVEETEPVHISELPLDIQRQIPNLTISSHIHSSTPSLRMVGINKRNYHEGDTIAQGLTLVSITENGVILAFLHYKFSVPLSGYSDPSI